MRSHPKTPTVQLVHARSEKFSENENWFGLYERMEDDTCVFSACSILRKAHGPLLAERRDEMRASIDAYAHARANMWRNTHRLGTHMNLPFDQDDVSIHVIIVILETSYRRARRHLFDGTNNSLVKFPCHTRGREKQVVGSVLKTIVQKEQKQ